MIIKDKYYSSCFSVKPVPDTSVDEECSPWQINLEDNQITNLSYDVASSNVIMFKTKSFGAVKKRDITKMSPNPLLGQGRRRRDIIDRVIMLLLSSHSH